MSRAERRVAQRLMALGTDGHHLAGQQLEVMDDWAGELVLERAAQDLQWGGPDVDNGRLPRDWAEYIRKQLHQLELELQAAPVTSDFEFFRERMVKVAALAVAAMQAHDRWLNSKGGQEAEDEGCGQCPACLLKKALGQGEPSGSVRVVEVDSPAALFELLSQLGLGGPTPRR